MSNQIVLKKSSISGKVPQSTDLVYGELALNYNDGNLYFRKSDDTIGSIGTSALKLQATDDNTSTTLYPVMVGASGSAQTPKIDGSTTPLSYDASTGTLSAQKFSGDGSQLTNLPSSGGAKAGAIYEGDATLTTSYAITAGKNAMSPGPVTIADGVTITIPSGSYWTIV